MIPKDYWEKLQSLWAVPPEEAGKLSNTDYNLWLKLQSLADEEGLNWDRIRAAEFNYSEAQRDTYQKTIDNCRKDVCEENNNALNEIRSSHRPSWDEAIKTMAFGAALEGVLRGGAVMVVKYQEGIKPLDYEKNDALDIAKGAGKGILIGGFRSGVVYVVTNFTPIPGGVASGAVTFLERTVTLSKEKSEGAINDEEYKHQMIDAAVDTTLTTTFSLIGAKVCRKNPVVGALLGTATAKVVLFVGRKMHMSYIQKLEQDCA